MNYLWLSLLPCCDQTESVLPESCKPEFFPVLDSLKFERSRVGYTTPSFYVAALIPQQADEIMMAQSWSEKTRSQLETPWLSFNCS
jgi:hypothetical protein